jgi:hypothetical protein
VAELSGLVIEREAQSEKIAEILLKIESMSPEEIERAIEEERGKRPRV